MPNDNPAKTALAIYLLYIFLMGSVISSNAFTNPTLHVSASIGRLAPLLRTRSLIIVTAFKSSPYSINQIQWHKTKKNNPKLIPQDRVKMQKSTNRKQKSVLIAQLTSFNSLRCLATVSLASSAALLIHSRDMRTKLRMSMCAFFTIGDWSASGKLFSIKFSALMAPCSY